MHRFIEISFLFPPLLCRSLTLSARFAVHSLVLVSLPHLKLKLTSPYPSIPHHMTTSLSLIIPLLFLKTPPFALLVPCYFTGVSVGLSFLVLPAAYCPLP